ncbi:MAG: hypothetical protein LBM96_09985, partial [Methanobrevibacter sp.]|nr:hypothetical protein [Candidatus Methanoflexus mossambicus]
MKNINKVIIICISIVTLILFSFIYVLPYDIDSIANEFDIAMVEGSVNNSVVDFGVLDINIADFLFINNTNAPEFVNCPDVYEVSPFFDSTNGFENKKNIINTKIINTKENLTKTENYENYTYITEYFLPMSWENHESWSNTQSIAINENYIYILVSFGNNQGFILQYDMDILNKYNISSEEDNGDRLSILRKLGNDISNNNELSAEQDVIKKSIKKGPTFNIGHGQSLSYDSQTDSLWMWQDDDYSSTELKLLNIDKNSLKPNKTYKFSIKCGENKIKVPHNLDFDKEGNFYFDYTLRSSSDSNGSSLIFKGKIKDNKIKIELLGCIENRPGTYAQSIAVNHLTNKLYLVSDGVFYTIPIEKLEGGNLTQEDLGYYVFNTSREFQGIDFDD